MKNLISTVIILFFLPFMVNAQTSNSDPNTSKLNMSRFIELKQSGIKEEVNIEVGENTGIFEYLIETSVTSGKLTIEILNPNNEREGIFSVGTQLNLVESEIATGSITDSYPSPIPGEWRIIIKPERATGEINIQHRFK